ncbi:dystroglycan isoform X2 [Hyposmocoma kahamanoa]|uniref:dystroglycan isoform X2 n=1 Tax=Hyposmocoma kahamanoa TaxID=1477025 RepID=UPI000E6DA4AE|nr:dystroglycan isoform X2 [Hyposmocoma kahamanoa]
MGYVKYGAYIGWTLLLLCPLALSRLDDDFAFDNSEEFQVELQLNHSEIEKNGLRRLWGVPDTSAYVGHLFRMEIPKEAFSGPVNTYKVRSEDGRHIPSWLAVDSKHGIISGIPQKQDLGAHTFTVTAHGRTHGLTATDSFTIEVKKAEDKPYSKYGICHNNENHLVLVILIDVAFQQIAPRQRIRALMDLANFMALEGDEFWMEPYKSDTSQIQTILMSGPGTTQRRRGDATTAIYLNVGCGDKLWSRHKVLVAGLREQSRDGTLAHTLRLSVLGWRLLALKPVPRPKRQSPLDEGSGTYETYDGDDEADYSGYDDGDDEDDFGRVDLEPDGIEQTDTTTAATTTSTSTTTTTTTLPVFTDTEIESTSFPTPPPTFPPSPPPTPVPPLPHTTPSPAPPPTALPTTTEEPITAEETTPEPASTNTYTTEEHKVRITPYSESASESSNIKNYTSLPVNPRRIAGHGRIDIVPEEMPDMTTEAETETVTSTERTSTIFGRTTETVTFAMPMNQPPTLKHHMKKLAITAGKAFRYIIPADLFTDPEEGSNLTFTMYEAENVKLSKNSWIQFIPNNREVYGLPLESHVSRWNFIVEAQDSEGLVARGPLDITVQQHKSSRTINHQFIIQFKLNKPFNNNIDWQIRALEGIMNLFRDTDMEELTVLNATQNGDIYEFVWTNDTLPKDSCPIDSISRLMKIMESESEKGAPSANLVRAMSPELKVSAVSWRGVGQCTQTVPTTKKPDTYPPVPRNQVDHLTATVGHLLVYKVPEDTFYDPEDGGTRKLHLSLRYSDRSELPSGHWLQFDAKNQEFYGLPSPSDEGSVTYQLIAEDSSKKSAYDSLMVEVVRAPTIRPTVEFRMTMEYPFPALAYNAHNKRKVVEKLAALFGQTDTSNIRIHSITDSPTTIIWYNTSLPMDRCPQKEIQELRRMIIADENGAVGGALKENVDHVFDKDLKVMSITLIPLGLCESPTKIYRPPSQPPNTGHREPGSAEGYGFSEHLVTIIIPAIVIICMILVAGIIACVLYRRRRTGKLGILVLFTFNRQLVIIDTFGKLATARKLQSLLTIS